MEEYINILSSSPGKVFVQLTASWCGPCNTIKQPLDDYIREHFDPDSGADMKFMRIDIDKNPLVYSFFRRAKVVRGVPAFFLYSPSPSSTPSSPVSAYPDDMVLGADLDHIKRMLLSAQRP